MSGTKIQLARNAAVVLAETFKSLSIPCYIMGFTADDLGHNVVHPHYVGWKNTPGERASLVRIKASANNDDGYSIRYAAEVLKKKKAEHNILFVISDGSPACMRYTRVDGIKDTALAIKEAGKVANVFGIGIGMQERKELKDMYKGSYVSIVDVRQLTSTLANQLKRIIRKF
jgi:nitric oxide reductase activation protein